MAMPNINEVFGKDNKWLKAADLQGKKFKLTIGSVELLTFDQDGKKQVKLGLLFNGRDKGMVVNKTNAAIIGAMHGPNTDKWIDKQITIYPGKVKFGTDMVDAIMVEQFVPAADPEDEIPFS
jgi:hypothetical protein